MSTCIGRTPVSGAIGCLEKFHISLKTDRTDYRERCWKQSHTGLTLLNVIDSSAKGFLEILSNVLVAQERSLSFRYERPDASYSSFTLMYFILTFIRAVVTGEGSCAPETFYIDF